MIGDMKAAQLESAVRLKEALKEVNGSLKTLKLFTHADGSEQEHTDSRLVEQGIEPPTLHSVVM